MNNADGNSEHLKADPGEHRRMTEQENIKVYELAKELGMDSISLLDKLKGLNIKVKNHMSELGAEEVQAARTSLGKKAASSDAAPKKKTVAKKKPAAEAAAPAAPEAEKPVAAKTVTKRAAPKAAAP